MPSVAAHCIRKSFLESGKRHLILTGRRGSGKSTLFQALIQNAQGACAFLTRAERGARVTVELNGEEVELGRYVGGDCFGMAPSAEGFVRFAEALSRAAEGYETIALDEIGYLEGGQEKFLTALFGAFAKRNVIAVVRACDAPHVRAILSREDCFVADTSRLYPAVSCAVMASGLSRRFGANKLAAELGGKTLLSYALALAKLPVFADRALFTRSEETAALCASFPVVKHSRPTRAEAIALATERLGGADGLLFLPADQPFLQEESVYRLLFAFYEHPDRVCRLAYGGEGGSPVLFPARLFERLRRLPPHAGGRSLLCGGEEAILVSAAEADELFDVDTREDLCEAERRLRVSAADR